MTLPRKCENLSINQNVGQNFKLCRNDAQQRGGKPPTSNMFYYNPNVVMMDKIYGKSYFNN